MMLVAKKLICSSQEVRPPQRVVPFESHRRPYCNPNSPIFRDTEYPGAMLYRGQATQPLVKSPMRYDIHPMQRKCHCIGMINLPISWQPRAHDAGMQSSILLPPYMP